MKIIVCMKQVPAGKGIEVNPETGALKRAGGAARTNPYDLFALEAALEIREKVGGQVIVLTMGPDQAEHMIRDAYSMGADDGILLSDRQFAGADVLATSYALSQAIRAIGEYDLIICGKQTTDGDTAQVGPAIAEHLNIPHAAWVNAIEEVTEQKITVQQNLASVTQVSRIPYPCLITVDQDMNVPRLPSYKLKQEKKEHSIRKMTFADMADQDTSHYGFAGSPTAVRKMFAPEAIEKQVVFEGTIDQKVNQMIQILEKKKYI